MGTLILNEINRTVFQIKRVSTGLLKKSVVVTARLLTIVTMSFIFCLAFAFIAYGAHRIWMPNGAKVEATRHIDPSEYGIHVRPSTEVNRTIHNIPSRPVLWPQPTVPVYAVPARTGLDLRSARTFLTEARRLVTGLSYLTR